MRERRRAAVERLAAMEIDVPLDPDELSRELEGAYEPGGFIDSASIEVGYSPDRRPE